MSGLFLKIVNMSISAGWLVLAVLLLRLLLKKAPKWIRVLMWSFVAIRLICPISMESVLSLIPSAETIRPEIMMDWTPEISTGIGSLDTVINPIISQTFAPKPYASANPLQIWIPVLGNLWILGIFGMLVYTALSYILLRRKVATAVLLEKNIYQSEYVTSPFVLGIIKPRIYLPFRMDGQGLEYVIAHEQAHIRRKDHWWKPLGFLLLAIHWFNPFVWLGYVLLCRDIELACDEKVVKRLDNESKANYSQALVECSVNRRSIAACPLAFGEVGVKERVKSVMNYQKPGFWIVIAAVIACAAVAVCFLTNPKTSLDEELSGFLDMQIAQHHYSEEHTGDHFVAVHHKVLDVGRSRGETMVYMWVLYQEYGYENGRITLKSGAHIPTVITAKRTDTHGHYELVAYWEPRDGSYYEDDIKEKFPFYLHNKAMDSQRYIDEQKAFCENAAIEYFASASNIGGAEGPSNVILTRVMTLADVLELSELGMQLTWDDLKAFQGTDVGSGLYVMKYPIDAEFYLLVGGEKTTGEPMYAYLNAISTGASCDLRKDDVEHFVKANQSSTLDYAIQKAIIEWNTDSLLPDGSIPAQTYYIYGMETKSGTPLAGQSNHIEETTVYVQYVYHRYYYSNGELERVAGVGTPAKITFTVDPENGYILKDFWEPNGGSVYAEEIRNNFPKDIADMVLDPQSDDVETAELETACLQKAEEYISRLTK